MVEIIVGCMTEGLRVTIRGVHAIVLGEHCTTCGGFEESSVEFPTERTACNGQVSDVQDDVGESSSAGLGRSGVDLSFEEAGCDMQVSDPQDDFGETRGAGLDGSNVDFPSGEASCDGQVSDLQDAIGEPRGEQEFSDS
jgi:hypothetical protein